MSLTLNMVGGAGSGLKTTDAILFVTVKAGSSVSMTKSGITLVPLIWTTDADSSFDVAIFSVPSSTFDSNDWTVTATLGSDSESATIVIDSAEKYSLEILYRLYLYHNGENNGIVGQKVYGSYGTVTLNNSNNLLVCYNNYSSGQYGITAYYGTSSTVDVTDYRTVVVTVTEVTYQSASNQQPRFGVINSKSGEMPGWSWAVVKSFTSAVTSESTYILDISSVTGSKQIGFGTFSGSGVKTIYVKIKDLYLEK